jgi:hypothetical protein
MSRAQHFPAFLPPSWEEHQRDGFADMIASDRTQIWQRQSDLPPLSTVHYSGPKLSSRHKRDISSAPS